MFWKRVKFWKRAKQTIPVEKLQLEVFKLLLGTPRNTTDICVELGLDDPAAVLFALEQLAARGLGHPNPDPENLKLHPELQEWSLQFNGPKAAANP